MVIIAAVLPLLVVTSFVKGKCDPPPCLANGHYSLIRGQTFRLSCNSGYKPSTKFGIIRCIGTRWLPYGIKCVACPTPPPIQNDRYTSIGSHSARFTCNKGYKPLLGLNILTCKQSLHFQTAYWFPAGSQCISDFNTLNVSTIPTDIPRNIPRNIPRRFTVPTVGSFTLKPTKVTFTRTRSYKTWKILGGVATLVVLIGAAIGYCKRKSRSSSALPPPTENGGAEMETINMSGNSGRQDMEQESTTPEHSAGSDSQLLSSCNTEASRDQHKIRSDPSLPPL